MRIQPDLDPKHWFLVHDSQLLDEQYEIGDHNCLHVGCGYHRDQKSPYFDNGRNIFAAPVPLFSGNNEVKVTNTWDFEQLM